MKWPFGNFFIYKPPWYFQLSFKSNGLSIEKDFEIDFQDGSCGSHFVFPIGMVCYFFIYKSPLYFLSSSQLTFQFLRSSKHSRWRLWWPSWISNLNYFSFFFIYRPPWYFQWSFESIGLSVEENNFGIDFQDASCGGHLGILIKMFLAIFDLQVALILPTKFPVKRHFHSGEVQNRFSRWGPFWISDWNDFSYFWSTSCPKTGVN